jgi:aminoglycoside phosphotransferase (APT) family kinase protein
MSGAAAWRSTPVRLLERRTRWLHRPEREWAGEIAPRLVTAVAAADADWRTETVDFTSTSLAVVTVGCPGSLRRFVVKVPWTAHGAESLRRQADVLASLHHDLRLCGLHPLMPRCIEQGEVDGRYYCIEEALQGVPASAVMARRARRTPLLAAATRIIGDLHARTREVTLLDRATVEAWVHAPLLRLEAFSAGQRHRNLLLGAIGRLRGELDSALAGRTVHTSWIHGDFWPGNLLAARSGTDVTGVVDWDGASPRQLPLHDLLHLHVFSRRLARGDELGDVVVRALYGGIGEAIDVPSGQVATWLDDIPQRSAVLLYWLRHVQLFIDTEGHHDNPRWLRANVERVLVNV